MNANKITVLIADDHTIVREALRLILDNAGDVEVVGEAVNGREAVEKAKALQPSVIIMDLGMPLLNGVEAIRQVRRDVPKTRVLVLSTYSEDHFIEDVMEAGATSYLVKQTASNYLLQAIRETTRGNAFFSPSISKRLLQQARSAFVEGGKPTVKKPRLTSRETEVLQLVAEGYANKQIADVLQVSIKTVEKHRQSVMHKLNIHEAASLTRYALAAGIVEQTPGPHVLQAN